MTYKKQEPHWQKKEKSHGKLSKRNLTSKIKRYEIKFKPSVKKELKKLSRSELKRISNKIDSLGVNPYQAGVIKLTDSDSIFKIRVGSFRILYNINKNELIILVLKIGNRKSVYRIKK